MNRDFRYKSSETYANQPWFITILKYPDIVQRVPALRTFWDLEKTVLHEIRVSGTVLMDSLNAIFPH